MTVTVTYASQVQLSDGTRLQQFDGRSFQHTLTKFGFGPGLVTIGATEEVIDFGDLDPGFVMIENLSADYPVEIGPESGGVMIPMHSIPAGQSDRFFRKAGVTIRAQGIGGSVDVQINAME